MQKTTFFSKSRYLKKIFRKRHSDFGDTYTLHPYNGYAVYIAKNVTVNYNYLFTIILAALISNEVYVWMIIWICIDNAQF